MISDKPLVKIKYCCSDYKAFKEQSILSLYDKIPFRKKNNNIYNPLDKIEWEKYPDSDRVKYDHYEFRCPFCGFPLYENRYE